MPKKSAETKEDFNARRGALGGPAPPPPLTVEKMPKEEVAWEKAAWGNNEDDSNWKRDIWLHKGS